MHPDKNCKFLAPCLLVLTFAMLPDFCDQALSQEGVRSAGLLDLVPFSMIRYYVVLQIILYHNVIDYFIYIFNNFGIYISIKMIITIFNNYKT